MHNDLSHRKILRQSDKSFIQLCIHKLEVKMSKLASSTTLKGGETGGTSNCPDEVRQENLQEERAREASDCPTGSNVIPTATNMPALATRATNPPPSTSSPPPPGILTAGMIKGNASSYVAGVVEWTFAESQSSIQGRTGSNACAFIALIMGKMWMNGSLLWPRCPCS